MNTSTSPTDKLQPHHEDAPEGPAPSSPASSHDYEMPSVNAEAALLSPPPQALLEPIEAGGLDMTELMEALKADAAAQECLVEIVGRVLDATVRRNDEKAHTPSLSLPLFESDETCPLCPSAYIQRILKYTACSPCNLVVALVYLQRLKDLESDPDTATSSSQRLRLTSNNLQRLLLTSLMLASKFLDEPFVSNKQWALVGDLTTREINALELEMLWSLKFSVNISREEYHDCHMAFIELDTAMALRKPNPEACDSTSEQGGVISCAGAGKGEEKKHHVKAEPQGPATPLRTNARTRMTEHESNCQPFNNCSSKSLASCASAASTESNGSTEDFNIHPSQDFVQCDIAEAGKIFFET